MIRLEKVGYRYPEREEAVLEDIDLSIRPGELVAVIGPNGSGKSTLAKLLNGLILPTQGKVTVEGLETTAGDLVWEVRRRVGLILQNPDNQMVAPTVEDDVAFGPENLGVEPSEIRRRIGQALQQVGMSEYAGWPPNRLSGGQKQRVAIAGVLAMQPNYLVLDEATSMLDPTGRKHLLTIALRLKASGVGVVMITHHMKEAALADRIVVLVNGKLVREGTPSQVFSASEALTSWGLATPFAVRVTRALKEQGRNLPPGILTVEELVNAICS